MRSPLTGWVTLLAVPRAALLNSTRELGWTIGLAGLVFVMAGLAVAFVFSRRIARGTAALNRAAGATTTMQKIVEQREVKSLATASLAQRG